MLLVGRKVLLRQASKIEEAVAGGVNQAALRVI
jgi:hypothetical protein